MSIGRRRKTDRVILRSAKQDAQAEYAWLMAKMITAIGVLQQYNRYVRTGPTLVVPHMPYVKDQLRQEYGFRKMEAEYLKKREEEKNNA